MHDYLTYTWVYENARRNGSIHRNVNVHNECIHKLKMNGIMYVNT